MGPLLELAPRHDDRFANRRVISAPHMLSWSPMKMATSGRVGLWISCAGLGLAAPGRPGYVNLGQADDLVCNYAVAAMLARVYAVLDATRI
jgi:hypothetical protein